MDKSWTKRGKENTTVLNGGIKDFSDKNLSLWYFLYFIEILLPQILLISAKGSTFDSVYKAGILVVFSVAYIYRLEQRRVFLFKNEELIFIAIYLTTSLAGILCADVLSLNVLILSITTALMYLYFFSVPRYLYTKKKTVDKFAFYYLVFIIYACIFNVIYYRGQPLLALFNGTGGYYTSFFDNKNTYGLFLFVGVVFATLHLSNSSRKGLNIFLLVFLFFNLLTCGSRTSLYCSILFIALYYLLANRKNWVAWAFIILILILGLVAINSIESLRTYLDEYIFRDDNSFDNRSEMALQALRHIEGWAWLVGYGEDAATYLSPYTGNLYFHNSFVAIFATGGIIKSILYLLIFWRSIRVGWMLYRKYSATVGAIFVSAFIAYIFYSWGESVVLLNGDTQSLILTFLLLSIPQLYLNAFQNAKDEEMKNGREDES